MNKPSRRRFTEEFKREAVKLLEQPGQTITGVARSLDVHRSQIERWRVQFAEASVVSRSSPGAVRETEQAELKRLRAEVRQLRMEREILKKATAFFANESN